MARSVPWRRSASDAASWHQDQSQNAIIYILRETGPTGFLLKEEGETKKYKVFLGDPHSCTCPVFSKEKDLCKHICWVLLKKFRLPRENPLSFQLGLVEREINELLHGIAKKAQKPTRRALELAKKASSQTDHNATGDGREMLQQKEITEDDVCPICQDELLEKREPVTYCRYGCGKSTHIRCMKVWAEHQKSTGEIVIKCPLCREDYGQIEDLQAEYRTATLQKTRQERRDDIHMGVVCKGCNQSPITGKCYRCSQCFDFSLCHDCFADKIHEEHSFQFRQKPTQRWRPAQRGSGAALPQAVLEDMLNRDLSEEDYDLLLQLDNDAANKPSNIPEHVIKSFPVETIRHGSAMLTPGTQCRVCLRGYEVGQVVRRLPCRHKYHVSCIDQWLTHEHPTCPVDGTVVWNPLTAEAVSKPKRKKRPQSLDRQNSTNEGPVLEIPGVGVAVRHGSLERVGGRRGRQVVDRVPDAHPGLDPLFALSGSAISSASGSESRQHLSSHGEARQNTSTRSGSKSTVRLGKTTNNRTSSSARTIDNLSVMGAGRLVNNRVDQQRTAMALHSRSNQDHVGNQHPVSHQRTHNRDRNSVNGNMNRNESTMSSLSHQMDGFTIGTSPVASPGRPPVAGPGWRPPPTTLANGQSHISSIPLPREAIMTPIGNQHHIRNSPSAARKPPRPDGGGAGVDRGRRNSRSEASRGGSRSSSASGRTGSRDRLQRGSPNKLETLENLFLGSPTGNLAVSDRTTPGSPSNRGHRSNQPRLRAKPFHASSGDGLSNAQEDRLDIALTGNRLAAPDL